MIALIVALVFDSGWWSNMDDWVNGKFPPYHLPHIMRCGWCQAWWLSLLWMLICGDASLIGVVMCLMSGWSVELWRAILGVLKANLLYIIDKLYIK